MLAPGLQADSFQITGRQMTVLGQGEQAQFIGNVEMTADSPKGEHFTGRGERALYDKTTERVTLWGKPAHVVRTEKARPETSLTVDAQKLIIEKTPKEIYARTQVVMTAQDPQSRWTSWSDEAHYQDISQKITLTAPKPSRRPKVFYEGTKGKGEYEAEQVEFDWAQRRMVAQRRVTGWFLLNAHETQSR